MELKYIAVFLTALALFGCSGQVVETSMLTADSMTPHLTVPGSQRELLTPTLTQTGLITTESSKVAMISSTPPTTKGTTIIPSSVIESTITKVVSNTLTPSPSSSVSYTATPPIAQELPNDQNIATYCSTETVVIEDVMAMPIIFSDFVPLESSGLGEAVFLANTDFSEVIQITGEEQRFGEPLWSPTHKYFVASSDQSSNYEIYIVDVDGNNPQRLTFDDDVSVNPTWSPSGTMLAYVSWSREQRPQIFTIDIETLEIVQLTNQENEPFNPDWSPDGDRIVYAGGNRNEPSNIFVVTVDGTENTQLTGIIGTAVWPRWSSSGKCIAFLANHEIEDPEQEGYELFIMRSDGSQLQRVLKASEYGSMFSAPSWSPDDRSLLVSTASGVYLVSIEDGGVTLLYNKSVNAIDWAADE